MASFKSIIQKILGVEHIFAQTGLVPGLAMVDQLVTNVQNAINVAEVNNPTDGQGAIKEASVINDTLAGLDVTQSILALRGEMVQQDQAKLKDAIAKQVAAMNAFKDWKESFKIVPIAKAAVPSK